MVVKVHCVALVQECPMVTEQFKISGIVDQQTEDRQLIVPDTCPQVGIPFERIQGLSATENVDFLPRRVNALAVGR